MSTWRIVHQLTCLRFLSKTCSLFEWTPSNWNRATVMYSHYF